MKTILVHQECATTLDGEDKLLMSLVSGEKKEIIDKARSMTDEGL